MLPEEWWLNVYLFFFVVVVAVRSRRSKKKCRDILLILIEIVEFSEKLWLKKQFEYVWPKFGSSLKQIVHFNENARMKIRDQLNMLVKCLRH